MKRSQLLTDRIVNDPTFVSSSLKLEEKDREIVDRIVRGFVEGFASPIDELVENAKSDPAVVQEIRRLLTEGSRKS